MWAVKDHTPAHLGVAFAVSGTEPDPDNAKSRTAVDAALMMRSRYWLPALPGGVSVLLDAAAGPALYVESDQPIRYGGYFEIGTSLHGMLGLFFAAEPTVSVQDQTLHTRYAVGAKTTAAGFLIVLSIYACSQAACY